MALRRVTRRLTPGLRIDNPEGFDRRWLICQEIVDDELSDVFSWTKAVGDNIILHQVKIHIDPISPAAALDLVYDIKTGLGETNIITSLDNWDWVFRSGIGDNPFRQRHLAVSEILNFDMHMKYRGLGRRFGFTARIQTPKTALMWVGFLIEEIGR